jgi:hypothetical protein
MGGRRCPGETECRKGEDPLHLLGRPSDGEEDEATGENSAAIVCPQCPLYRTKPGLEPPAVTQAINFAMEHEEEVKNGLRMGTRDMLSAMEWASCRGLSRGRAKYDEYLEEKRQQENP